MDNDIRQVVISDPLKLMWLHMEVNYDLDLSKDQVQKIVNVAAEIIAMQDDIENADEALELDFEIRKHDETKDLF